MASSKYCGFSCFRSLLLQPISALSDHCGFLLSKREWIAFLCVLIILDSVYFNRWSINLHENYVQVMAIQEQGLTLLHLACLFGDARLAKACLTVVISPLPPNVRSWSGLTSLEVAASQGSTRLMDVLLKAGAHAPKSILVAACVGKAYTGILAERTTTCSRCWNCYLCLVGRRTTKTKQ